MKKFLLFFAILISSLTYSQNSEIKYGNNPKAGNYAEVNGIKMYYEIYGEGQPLLLLHGNGGAITSHSQRIEYFKEKYKVIAVDSRAHGKTSDNADSLTYHLMADDIYKLLEKINVDSALIFGQSDGAIIGLILAMDHPEKVKRLATFGANIFMNSTSIQKEIIDLVLADFRRTKDEHKKNYIGFWLIIPILNLKS